MVIHEFNFKDVFYIDFLVKSKIFDKKIEYLMDYVVYLSIKIVYIGGVVKKTLKTEFYNKSIKLINIKIYYYL